MADGRHGVDVTFWDNIGGGWRISCLCGFTTSPDDLLQWVGSEMDDHLADEKAYPVKIKKAGTHEG